jgi:thiol-disulfide isomerase/thioredoxin
VDVMKKDQTRYLITFLLSLWLGFLAADRFYLSQYNKSHIKWAIWKLFTIGGFGIWWLSDLIYIASHRHKFNELIDNKWKWRKYSKVIAPIATAFMIVCILLIIFAPATQVYVDPSDGPVGTRFKVNVMFLRPLASITETTINIDNQKVMETVEYRANLLGSLNFVIPSAAFDKGNYRCTINSNNVVKSVNFTITAVLARPACVITPTTAIKGAEITVECYGLSGSQTKYHIIKTTTKKSVFIGSGSIDINSNGHGSFLIHTENLGRGDYSCRIVNNNDVIVGNFSIELEPPYCYVDPEIGTGREQFTVRCKGLVPRQMAIYQVYKLDKGIEKQYGSAGEKFIDSDGNLTFTFICDKCETGYYQCKVTDNLRTVSDNFSISFVPPHECAEIDCNPPPFSLKSVSGSQINLYSEFGTPIWINFWNTSCPGCTEYMTIIQTICNTWPENKIKVYSINVGEDKEKIMKFLTDRGYTFYTKYSYPVLIGDSYIKGKYEPRGDPAHYFIDKNGFIRITKFGFKSVNTESEVLEILKNLDP